MLLHLSHKGVTVSVFSCQQNIFDFETFTQLKVFARFNIPMMQNKCCIDISPCPVCSLHGRINALRKSDFHDQRKRWQVHFFLETKTQLNYSQAEIPLRLKQLHLFASAWGALLLISHAVSHSTNIRC